MGIGPSKWYDKLDSKSAVELFFIVIDYLKADAITERIYYLFEYDYSHYVVMGKSGIKYYPKAVDKAAEDVSTTLNVNLLGGSKWYVSLGYSRRVMDKGGMRLTLNYYGPKLKKGRVARLDAWREVFDKRIKPAIRGDEFKQFLYEQAEDKTRARQDAKQQEKIREQEENKKKYSFLDGIDTKDVVAAWRKLFKIVFEDGLRPVVHRETQQDTPYEAYNTFISGKKSTSKLSEKNPEWNELFIKLIKEAASKAKTGKK